MGITHVLNTAQGSKFATVDTDAGYYENVGIKYMGMKLLDFPSANITQYFESGADFIEEALNGGGEWLAVDSRLCVIFSVDFWYIMHAFYIAINRIPFSIKVNYCITKPLVYGCMKFSNTELVYY